MCVVDPLNGNNHRQTLQTDPVHFLKELIEKICFNNDQLVMLLILITFPSGFALILLGEN